MSKADILHFRRWGRAEQAVTLSEEKLQTLAAQGMRGCRPSTASQGQLTLGEGVLSSEAVTALCALVGEEAVARDATTRLDHTRGWSTPDLLRLRAGDTSGAPDAVVFPGSHDEVVALLALCTRLRVAVVPYAGGTSVVGGLACRREGLQGVVALDVRRLDALVAIDEVSRVATLQTGLSGPDAERALNERGYTLGHFPQSYEGASIGGYAAARSSGQASTGYGRFDEMVVGLTVATPRGTLDLGTAPKSAAGPDLRQLMLGSEGALGVITSVRVRLRPTPQQRYYEGWRFADFQSGVAALRHLAQDGPLPTVLRLSDEAETENGAAGGDVDGCLAIIGYEGTAARVEALRSACAEILHSAGGEPLGTGPGRAWQQGRFQGPCLRDPLLDAGVLVETLETATFWSRIPALWRAVRTALTEALASQGTPATVMCHISHVYETGASLYFTVICAQKTDPVEQWWRAKNAASEAIRSAGAACTHHHGVGSDHSHFYAREIGPLAVSMLRAVKATVDPAAILNPGVLLESPDD